MSDKECMMKMLFGMKSVKHLMDKEEEEGILSVPPLEEEDASIADEESEDEEFPENEEEENCRPIEEKKESICEKVVEVSKPSIDFQDPMHHFLMRMEMMNGEIFRKLDMISNRIERIEERLTHIEECQKYSYAEFNGEIIKIKEIKQESYGISDQDVLKALIYKDYRSVIYIFKLQYRSIQGGKIFYPIRMKNKRTFEYYYNGRWIIDPNGHQSIKIICGNVQNLFLKHNVVENKCITEEMWYLNQQFIMKLSEEKYKREMWKHIVDEILMVSS